MYICVYIPRLGIYRWRELSAADTEASQALIAASPAYNKPNDPSLNHPGGGITQSNSTTSTSNSFCTSSTSVSNSTNITNATRSVAAANTAAVAMMNQDSSRRSSSEKKEKKDYQKDSGNGRGLDVASALVNSDFLNKDLMDRSRQLVNTRAWRYVALITLTTLIYSL